MHQNIHTILTAMCGSCGSNYGYNLSWSTMSREGWFEGEGDQISLLLLRDYLGADYVVVDTRASSVYVTSDC